MCVYITQTTIRDYMRSAIDTLAISGAALQTGPQCIFDTHNKKRALSTQIPHPKETPPKATRTTSSRQNKALIQIIHATKHGGIIFSSHRSSLTRLPLPASRLLPKSITNALRPDRRTRTLDLRIQRFVRQLGSPQRRRDGLLTAGRNRRSLGLGFARHGWSSPGRGGVLTFSQLVGDEGAEGG